ncbi:MAG: GGDEF domain-containing protein [Bacillota bacterium]
MNYGARAVALDDRINTEQVRYNYHSYEIKKNIRLSFFFKKLRIWYTLFCFALALAIQPYLQNYLTLLILIALLGFLHSFFRYYRSVSFAANSVQALLLTSVDFVMICGLGYVTGGILSVFHIGYCLPILACTILFGLKSGFSSLRLAVLFTCTAIFAPLPAKPIPALFYFIAGVVSLVFMLWTVSVLIKEEQKLREELYTASVTDHLTGLYHSGYLKERLQEEIMRCRRARGKFAIIFLDLDRFKTVNDCYGHVIGNRVLIHVTDILKELVRGGETLARFGGDEFIVLMPGAGRDQARQALERLSEAIENTPCYPAAEIQVKLGVSGGVAEYPKEGDTIERLLQVADSHMYNQKG